MPTDAPHPFVLELHDLAAKHGLAAYIAGIIVTDENGGSQFVATGAMKLAHGTLPPVVALEQMFDAVRNIEQGLVEQASPQPRELMN